MLVLKKKRANYYVASVVPNSLLDPRAVACQAFLSMGILQARILEWVLISFYRASSQLREQTWVSCMAGRFFTACTTRETLISASVHLLSCVQLFAIPWIAAHQATFSITNSRSSPKLMSIESVMPSSHLILCHPLSSCLQSLPGSESFPMSQLFTWGGQSIGVSALATVLPMNTQDWSPLEQTGWISLQSKGLSRVFSNTTVQKHQFFSAQPSSQFNSDIHTGPLEKP